MSFEHIETGKSARQIIEETLEDLDQVPYAKQDRDEMKAKLLTARIATVAGSADRRKIDELLLDIETRYGDS